MLSGHCLFGRGAAVAAMLEPAADYVRVQLNDARHVSIRPILPSDLQALRTFFATLSRETRRLRFHSAIGELSEHVLREFTMVNHRAHVAFVAEIHDSAVDPSTTLVAEARYVRSADS
jgi:hypothetical protein